MGFHNFALYSSLVALLWMVVALPVKAGGGRDQFGDLDSIIRSPVEKRRVRKDDQEGTTWAVLVAGSYGFGNYRHQADICHAYQLLKKGGLKDENIVVMMYDDIADSMVNPRPGVIINHPKGRDVYAGVPKDYTKKQVTADNFYAVLLADKAAIKGGSGKVIDSKPNDRIFIFYSDHGGPGVLGMPNMPFVYANDFIEVLKKKHALGTYKDMVIYVESCESGSIFSGLLPENLNIYVTTASDVDEDSWGTYCPGMDPPAPPDFITCLGDLYSVAWMEDSESHNRKRETIKQQFEKVKKRASKNNTYNGGSHVMEYGTKAMKAEKLYLYQGFNPSTKKSIANQISRGKMGVVDQRDAEILFLWERYKKMEHGSESKDEILKEITDTMLHRTHVDSSMEMIGVFLFGPGKRASSVLKHVRRHGLAIVDDWDCLKSMVRVFETHCGSLTQYGMKHMRAFANICNNGVSKAAMEEACVATCGGRHIGQWSPLNHGFSA